MEQKIIDALSYIGLTKTEIKAYLTLLDVGQSLTGNIADKANLYRKNVYDALNSLHKKGLVSYLIKSNRKYWEATSPERVTSIVLEKLNLVKEITPKLIDRFKARNKERSAIYFEGFNGMKSFYDDMHKEGKDIFILGATGKAYNQLKYFIHSWSKKMRESKIKSYILWNHDAINKEEFTIALKSKNKTLPKEFTTPTQVFIYGEKSGILIWSENPTCILIKDKGISGGFKKYFDFMWKISKVENNATYAVTRRRNGDAGKGI